MNKLKHYTLIAFTIFSSSLILGLFLLFINLIAVILGKTPGDIGLSIDLIIFFATLTFVCFLILVFIEVRRRWKNKLK